MRLLGNGFIRGVTPFVAALAGTVGVWAFILLFAVFAARRVLGDPAIVGSPGSGAWLFFLALFPGFFISIFAGYCIGAFTHVRLTRPKPDAARQSMQGSQ
jgi:hypothetical protein